MIINITNITAASALKGCDYPAMAAIAAQDRHTARFDGEYYCDAAKSAFLYDITCDKLIKGVCVCRDMLIPDSCEVESLCIDAEYKGIGLARKLLSHALRDMRSLKYRAAFVWVNEANESALGFFRRFGFADDGRRRKSRTSGDNGDELRLRIDI